MTEPSDEGFTDPGPYDIPAEQAVLGSMMLSPAEAANCLNILTAPDLFRPAHQVIFGQAGDLLRSTGNADVLAMAARLQETGDLLKCGGLPYLHTLIAAVPVAATAVQVAEIVRDRAVRRRLKGAGESISRLAYADGDVRGLTERAVRDAEAVRDAGQADDVTTQTIAEFLDVPEGADDYDWVVPGLLERGDRFVLTGMEGAGKSTLFRMLAVTIAAGIHPFNLDERIKPQRVLVVDCENGAAHTRRKIRPLVLQADKLGSAVQDTNLWVEIRPEGLDLATDKDASWLLRRVATIGPDVVAIGPLVKLAPRALNDDTDAAPVIAVLNMIRARGACVLLEAHAGHAVGAGGRRDLRPRGSSQFLGWPEFGYGIRYSDLDEAKHQRLVDMVAWRGDRDERDWPAHLVAGGVWPWSAYTPPPKPATGNGRRDDPWNAHRVLVGS